MFEAGGTEAAEFAGKMATQGPMSATLQWVGSRLRMLGGLTPKVASEIADRLMTTNPQAVQQLTQRLAQIEKAQISAAQKSQMVQNIVRTLLTSQTAVAIGQN
jgi:recombinational DNA repair protein RecR